MCIRDRVADGMVHAPSRSWRRQQSEPPHHRIQIWAELASFRGDSAIGRRPVLRLTTSCYD
eukprot:12752589-Alexandrium_andersonii.AAC.1